MKPKVFYNDSRNMKEVKDGTVRTVVTSPPYWDMYYYGHDEEIGYGQTYEKYLDSLDKVWEQCYKKLVDDGTEKLFVIGGSRVFRNFIHLADELHITELDKITDGIDTYFPVTMLIINQEFYKIEERILTENTIYSHWIRN